MSEKQTEVQLVNNLVWQYHNVRIPEELVGFIIRQCIHTLHQHGWIDAANDMAGHFDMPEEISK